MFKVTQNKTCTPLTNKKDVVKFSYDISKDHVALFYYLHCIMYVYDFAETSPKFYQEMPID